MDIVTADFSKFGTSELILAAKLLELYAEDGAEFLGNHLTVSFNMYSGYVFLTDEDYNVGVLNSAEEHIVQFFSCPECGYEGTQEEALTDGKDFCKHEGYCSFECYKHNQ